MKKPHVIILMADQLRYDVLGSLTPNIADLQKESVNFNRSYCTSPLCVPARGSFFTGKYPNITGAIHNAKISKEKSRGFVKKCHKNLYELMEGHWDSWHTGKMDFRTEERIEKNKKTKTTWLPLEPRYEQFLIEKKKQRPGGVEFRGIVPSMLNGEITYKSFASIPKVGNYKSDLDFFYDGFILKDTLKALKQRNTKKRYY